MESKMSLETRSMTFLPLWIGLTTSMINHEMPLKVTMFFSNIFGDDTHPQTNNGAMAVTHMNIFGYI